MGGTTGKDMVLGLRIIDAPGGPDVVVVENTEGGMEEGDESIGQQWRSALVMRNFTSHKRKTCSGDYGGPESRKRHYEVNVRKYVGLGVRQNI